MITFHIISIFPESFKSYFHTSILKRAQEKKLIKIKFYNPRDFSVGRYKKVDDKPYGGGPGMVMMVEPIIKAVGFAKQKSKIILLSARGKQFNREMAIKLTKGKNITLICGHYEGIDERIKKVFKIEEVSIGPYILSGGEAGAMVVIDAVSRHIPGVLGKIESLEEKKGSYPVYTRPEVLKYKGKKYSVPEVLLSGDHKKISEWRKKYGKMK
jgi:tRNA (guanine37-N1)-methyltransferase